MLKDVVMNDTMTSNARTDVTDVDDKRKNDMTLNVVVRGCLQSNGYSGSK